MEYDDTNRGAAFKPFDSQQLILQGKVNIEGNEEQIVLVKNQTKAGATIIEVYQKAGVLFSNDKKGNDAAPDYTGPIKKLGWLADKRAAAWKKISQSGAAFLSINVTDPQEGQGGGGNAKPQAAADPLPEPLDDKIPF